MLHIVPSRDTLSDRFPHDLRGGVPRAQAVVGIGRRPPPDDARGTLTLRVRSMTELDCDWKR